MINTNSRYDKQMIALIDAYDHLQDACNDIYEALSTVWGVDYAEKNIAPLYDDISKCEDFIQDYLGRISFLGFCVFKK